MFLTINDIREISAKMSEKIGVDYSGYSITSFRRHLMTVFDKLGIHKVQELDGILSDVAKRDELAHNMMIPATELFRDPGFWRALRKLLAGKTSLKVWMPELTNGFELYSLLVLLKQIGITNVEVVGQVVSKMTEDEIKSLSIQEKYDEVNRSNFERLESGTKYEDFFVKNEEGILKPSEDLLKNVKFERGWFMNNDVEKYDLIIFRNILLNYGPRLHERVIERLAQSLNSGGLLAIGIKEILLTKSTELKPVEVGESIYRI